MSFILDTCVISELIKKLPDNNVLKWLSECEEDQLFISCLSLGEIRFGIDILPESRKKNDLILWFDDIQESFRDSTLPITNSICIRWGEERAKFKKKGLQLPVVDAIIACTAIDNNYTLVTRNTHDFEIMNIALLNPWL